MILMQQQLIQNPPIVLADRKNPKRPPLRSRVDVESAYFAYRWRHRPASQPLVFDLLTLRRPITTTTMADYMLVFMLQKILNLSVLPGQNILLLCHYAEQKKDYGQPTSYFRLLLVFGFCFYFLFVYSAQASCACSTTYRPGIWTTACWAVYNRSIWTQIFLKRCRGWTGEKKTVLGRVDMA